MARNFNFSVDVKNKAFFRQWNLCAHCGKSLTNVFDHAHHVLPNQAGARGNPNDSWIKSVDNCVILCESCHFRVHENGRYRTGAASAPKYFPYSHGRQKQEHQFWVRSITPKFWSTR